MHSMDGSRQSAAWEDSAMPVAHQTRESADGCAICGKRNRKSDILCLEKIQHRIGMRFGRSKKVFTENLRALEVFPFGRVRTPEVLDQLITEMPYFVVIRRRDANTANSGASCLGGNLDIDQVVSLRDSKERAVGSTLGCRSSSIKLQNLQRCLRW